MTYLYQVHDVRALVRRERAQPRVSERLLETRRRGGRDRPDADLVAAELPRPHMVLWSSAS